MSTLAKPARSAFHGRSGSASEVATALRGVKNMRVVAIEFEPGQQHLETTLLKALDLLAMVVEENFTKKLQDRVRQLGDLLTETIEIPQTALIELRMKANVIRHLMEEGSWLSAAQIAEQGGYSPSNSAEPASRWKREGKVFSITLKGQDLYPAYQFDDCMKPRPVIAEVLKIFKHKTDTLAIAAWFASVNGWLRSKRPQDSLDEPAKVTEAARQEVSGFNG